MTAIFRIPDSGAVQNVQVGVVDLVTTASAAHSVWGWVGGLRGIQAILSAGRDAVPDRSSVFSPPSMLPSACRVLTFNGIATLQDESSEAFGGDYNLQMIGLTLCALSRELRPKDAIEVMMETLVPKRFRDLLKDFSGAREALYTQLTDNCTAILNEGASRGLSDRFARAELDLHLESLEAGSPGLRCKEVAHDFLLVGGLLNWIGLGCPKSYFTRSLLVLRIAAYLKEIGYSLGRLSTWDGHGTPPAGIRAVFLVLGGSTDTDSYVDWGQMEGAPMQTQISHFRYSTVGAMLSNTLRYQGPLSSEAFQDYFEVVEKTICQTLTFSWKFDNESFWSEDFQDGLMAFTRRKAMQESRGNISVRLAAFYFARCTELVAPCYQRIAQHNTLEIVKRRIDNVSMPDETDVALCTFRVITISIILAVFGQLGGVDFKTIRHCTRLSLGQPRMLRSLANQVETLLVDGLSSSIIAAVLAYLHAGGEEPDNLLRQHEMTRNTSVYDGLVIVGFRNTNYCVLPALLSKLAEGPSQASLGFDCFDFFIGNVPVWGDGTIKSTLQKSTLFRDDTMLRDLSQGRSDYGQLGSLELATQKAAVAAPALWPPDVPLYLNIERAAKLEGPILGLCGRVHGTAVGNVGVPAILRTIAQSFGDDLKRKPESCPKRHLASSSAVSLAPSRHLIIPASVWSRSRPRPIADRLMHVYIPVQEDSAWALFLSGETDSVICRCCADCAAANSPTEEDESAKECVLIGYQG